jgi:hypothetical protein
MKYQSRAKTFSILLISLGFWIPVSAEAFPFQPTPEGFKGYLNSIGQWTDGSEYKFLDVRGCYSILNTFSCQSSDYIQTNLLGSRTCINRWVQMNSIENRASFYEGSTTSRFREENNCSPYEKESEMPVNKLKEPTIQDGSIGAQISKFFEPIQSTGRAGTSYFIGFFILLTGVAAWISFAKRD